MPALRPMLVPWVCIVCLIHECQRCLVHVTVCVNRVLILYIMSSEWPTLSAKGPQGLRGAVFHILVPPYTTPLHKWRSLFFSSHVI